MHVFLEYRNLSSRSSFALCTGVMSALFLANADGLVPVVGISRAEDHINLVKAMFQIQTRVAMAIGSEDVDASLVNMTWLTTASEQTVGQRSEYCVLSTVPTMQ
jgi:hypothetical protein